LAANDISSDDELILRRVQLSDGRTRAFVNDQPVSVQVLKQLGSALVEIHGQHDERALTDAATHRRLLDAFGGLDGQASEVETLWQARRDAREAAEAHRAEGERAAREPPEPHLAAAAGAKGAADWLRPAVDELIKLAPQAVEETALAERRT